MRGTAATLACFAAVALLLAWSRWLARRRWASAGYLAMAAGCAATAALTWAFATALDDFSALRHDAAVARIRFDDAGPGRFRATLMRLPQGRVQVFELPGNEWRITVDTLEWPEPLGAAGLKPAYRLESLASREPPAGTGPAGPARSYSLADSAGFDLWDAAQSGRVWSQIAFAARIAGPWQPVQRAGEYTVRLQDRTLLVEPAGDSGTTLYGGR